MLFPIDTLYGHIVIDTPDGSVYQDDQTPVTPATLRPCLSCGEKCTGGEHDPCILNLPETEAACCGHGLERSPNGNLPGYVSLKDGRSLRFSGTVGSSLIRKAVDAALACEELPSGFYFDEQKMWWAGLTNTQRQYVYDRMTSMLANIRQELRPNEPSSISQKIIDGKMLWYEELTQAEKDIGFSAIPNFLGELAKEAIANS